MSAAAYPPALDAVAELLEAVEAVIEGGSADDVCSSCPPTADGEEWTSQVVAPLVRLLVGSAAKHRGFTGSARYVLRRADGAVVASVDHPDGSVGLVVEQLQGRWYVAGTATPGMPESPN